MAIHDWTRVHDCLFHDFHLSWVAEMCRQLNQGRLPPSHFALSETLELRPPPGFASLPEPDQHAREVEAPEALLLVGNDPPRTRFTVRRERIEYANRAVTIRDSDTHAAVAAILVVSQQDRQLAYRWQSIFQHAVGALLHGIHLLVIDLFPPDKRNPQSIHDAIWDRFCDASFELPPDKPLTLAAYESGSEIAAYVEPVAVGDALPDMPIFLGPSYYVPCPLEETYQATWGVFPAVLKGPLEASS